MTHDRHIQNQRRTPRTTAKQDTQKAHSRSALCLSYGQKLPHVYLVPHPFGSPGIFIIGSCRVCFSSLRVKEKKTGTFSAQIVCHYDLQTGFYTCKTCHFFLSILCPGPHPNGCLSKPKPCTPGNSPSLTTHGEVKQIYLLIHFKSFSLQVSRKTMLFICQGLFQGKYLGTWKLRGGGDPTHLTVRFSRV